MEMEIRNESISSFQNHIMTKLLLSDNIVRAVADNRPNFLDEDHKYSICDDLLPEYDIIDDTLREIVKNGCINRFALKYSRLLPYLYDNDTITEQTVFIFFDISRDSTSRFVNRLGQNNLIIPYEIYINIYVHNNLVVTAYNKSRSVYISEEIEALLKNKVIGRKESRSLTDVQLRYNRPEALMNGRIHGRNMLFTAAGIDLRC